ncbi:hypothetical protein GUJ93_ZPchr0010g7209 [Zizania palustris]|uniref:Uncharacterized protein n=1 Tax=Zizania palustris TaxID=103762 RepID=A0A8J5W906_ZIZPA|nr:hypothetical protein GUJ93_ZPchr0010g7209 [Zizania palustris]
MDATWKHIPSDGSSMPPKPSPQRHLPNQSPKATRQRQDRLFDAAETIAPCGITKANITVVAKRSCAATSNPLSCGNPKALVSSSNKMRFHATSIEMGSYAPLRAPVTHRNPSLIEFKRCDNICMDDLVNSSSEKYVRNNRKYYMLLLPTVAMGHGGITHSTVSG